MMLMKTSYAAVWPLDCLDTGNFSLIKYFPWKKANKIMSSSSWSGAVFSSVALLMLTTECFQWTFLQVNTLSKRGKGLLVQMH